MAPTILGDSEIVQDVSVNEVVDTTSRDISLSELRLNIYSRLYFSVSIKSHSSGGHYRAPHVCEGIAQ